MKTVFFKIYLIWFFRRIVPIMILEIAILLVALKTFTSKVFVGRVLENAALSSDSDYLDFFSYLAESFFQANPLVQIIILVLLGVGALLIRDVAKIGKTYFSTVWTSKKETK